MQKSNGKFTEKEVFLQKTKVTRALFKAALQNSVNELHPFMIASCKIKLIEITRRYENNVLPFSITYILEPFTLASTTLMAN